MPRAEWQVVKDTLFRIPSVKEQAVIVQFLDDAESLLHNYQKNQKDIENLQREKIALIQQLLTGKHRAKIEEKVI